MSGLKLLSLRSELTIKEKEQTKIELKDKATRLKKINVCKVLLSSVSYWYLHKHCKNVWGGGSIIKEAWCTPAGVYYVGEQHSALPFLLSTEEEENIVKMYSDTSLSSPQCLPLFLHPEKGLETKYKHPCIVVVVSRSRLDTYIYTLYIYRRA